jgi:hypothetical protein
MRYNSFRNPSLGAADGGLFENDLVLNPPPYAPEPAADLGEEALRLDREPVERPVRRKPGISRGLILAGWAVALGAALGVAVIVQPTHELPAQPDLPPPSAPAATDDISAPATAPSIASQPQFSGPPAAAEAPRSELQVADAPTPPAPPAPPVTQPTPRAATPVAATFEDADHREKASKVEKTATPPVKPKTAPARLEKVSARPPAGEHQTKSAAHKAMAPDAKDLPQLKARMTKAYALAVKAGTPKSVLKARQAEWPALKAKAEKKGPAAVAALYKTRAAQLEALAKKTSARGRGKA